MLTRDARRVVFNRLRRPTLPETPERPQLCVLLGRSDVPERVDPRCFGAAGAQVLCPFPYSKPRVPSEYQRQYVEAADLDASIFASRTGGISRSSS